MESPCITFMLATFLHLDCYQIQQEFMYQLHINHTVGYNMILKSKKIKKYEYQ